MKIAILSMALPLLFVACEADRESQVQPPGQESPPKEEALKVGAEVLQGNKPTDKLDVYLVGFHPIVDTPTHQMEAHHFCHQVNTDFAQCVLFDGNEDGANLNGVEYIISEKLFAELPEEEKQYWHPHNFEILSGQLVAPGLPDVAEHELMAGKMNSYGKTWHFWHTGGAGTPGEKFPLGPPTLAWSFNADGEVKPELLESRDSAMGLNTEEARENRQDLVEKARPQRGVDRLSDAYPQRKKPEGIKAAPADGAPPPSP